MKKSNIRKNLIINKLKLKDKTIYDSYFNKKIMDKGEEYCNKGKVINIKRNKKCYQCNVVGTNTYNVLIELDHNKIKNMNCNCLAFEKSKTCKHIYALLYKLKYKKNYKKIRKYILNNIKILKYKIIMFEKDKNYNVDMFNEMKKHYYKDIIPRLEYLANKFYTEDTLLNIALESEDTIRRLENNLYNVEIINIDNKEKNVIPKQKHSNISLILLGFLKGMKNASKSKKKTIPDWVYEEAKKGNYEPFEFYDNELDDDMPYYSDDDE